MVLKLLVLFLVVFLVGCGAVVEEVSDYNERDVVLSDVEEEIVTVEEEGVDDQSQESSDMKKAEEKLDDAKEKYKEELKASKDLKGNESKEKKMDLENVRDLLRQAEKDFDEGDYSESIKFSKLVLDML